MFKKSLFLLAVIMLVCLSLPVQAAIKGEGLTISPPIEEMTLKPGESYPAKIKITNPTDKDMEVYPMVMNFKAATDSGEPSFYSATDEEQAFSLAHWITFSQTKIALTPDQVVEFDYEINVPKDAEAGGHYGVIFFSTQPPTSTEEANQVSITSMIGTLLLVRVPGEITESAAVAQFTVDKKYYTDLPVNFVTKITNNGNVHFKPQGTIKVGDITMVFNEQKGNVLPDSTRTFKNVWPKTNAALFGVPFGKFTANLNLTYGEDNKPLTSTVSFWIIPWWFIIALIVVVVILIIIIIWLIVRSRRRKNLGQISR